LHLLALWIPRALFWSYALLRAGAVALALPRGARPLSLSALAAALATVLLLWPAAFERALDPLLMSGLGAALVATLLAPTGSEVGVAALAAVAGGAILRSGATLSAPPPDLEASYQLIGVALAAGWLLSTLRKRFAPRLWGGAARV
jgi:hypothetical protein